MSFKRVLIIQNAIITRTISDGGGQIKRFLRHEIKRVDQSTKTK